MTPLRDPGEQAERTLLAWTRTCVGLAAVGLLLVRLTVLRAPLVLAGVPPLVAAALALHLGAQRRYRRVSSGSDRPDARLLTAVTVAGVLVAALCGLTVLV